MKEQLEYKNELERKNKETEREREIPEVDFEEEENRRREEEYNFTTDHTRMPYNTRTRAGRGIVKP